MPGLRDMRVSFRLLIVSCVMLFAPLPLAAQGVAQEHAKEQVQRQQTQPLNNAPVWRDVRSGETPPYQTSQVRGIETTVLVQSGGEIWRQIRNGPITIYGGWLIVLVVAAIGLFYWRKGAIKLHGKPTGRLVERFNSWARIIHWSTAISFVILGITGLVILFGKYVVLPLLGPTVFSWLAVLAKNLHNFVGPLFAVCTVIMIVTFVKDNLPKAHDLKWFAKAGGLFTGEHVPSGRFNAGEKSWFWVGVILLGIVVSVTGFILDFPNFEQGRLVMQQANVVHAVAALVFIVLSLGHIYMGTIGIEGAYESMRNGYVDETWAKEHHEYWYNEVMAGKGMAGGSAPSTARASSVKEGWKL
jgi:formate dehydrogenase subunit gamma